MVVVKDSEKKKDSFLENHVIQDSFASYSQPLTFFEYTFIGRDVFVYSLDKEGILSSDLKMLSKL